MSDPTVRCDPGAGPCHLCGDVAVVGRVLDVDPRLRTGQVAIDGILSTVAFDLVDAKAGDDVLVHLGFAIERVGSS